MRYHEYRAPLHQRVHPARNYRFRARIYGRRRFVEYHDGRIGDGGARYRYELTLTLRQVCAVAREHGVVAVGQSCDKIVRAGELSRGYTFLVGGVQLAVADIVHDRARKQVRVLQYYAERAAQVGFFYLVDVDAVVAHFAVGDVVKPVEQVGYRSFARARRADESDLLPRLGVDGNVAKHRLALFVLEVDLGKHNVAAKPRIRDCAVAVRVLPRPFVGALLALR